MELFISSHLSFCASNSVGVGNHLPFGGVTDNFFPVPFKSDNRRGGHRAFRVRDNFHFAIGLHVADDTIGGTEVDTDDNFFCHIDLSPLAIKLDWFFLLLFLLLFLLVSY